LRIDGGKVLNLGCYHKEEDAAIAYDMAAREYGKTGPALNFPDEVNFDRMVPGRRRKGRGRRDDGDGYSGDDDDGGGGYSSGGGGGNKRRKRRRARGEEEMVLKHSGSGSSGGDGGSLSLAMNPHLEEAAMLPLPLPLPHLGSTTPLLPPSLSAPLGSIVPPPLPSPPLSHLYSSSHPMSPFLTIKPEPGGGGGTFHGPGGGGGGDGIRSGSRSRQLEW